MSTVPKEFSAVEANAAASDTPAAPEADRSQATTDAAGPNWRSASANPCAESPVSSTRPASPSRAYVLSLEGLAGAESLAAGAEGPTRAAVPLGAAHAARRGVGAPLPAAERADVDRITARTTTALGEEAFRAAFERGAGMAPEEAAALARTPTADRTHPATRATGVRESRSVPPGR
ncbi:hypothetical protein [Streptomyces sp. NPDC015350]|uniref:hypothetical protein n=1 Tax=Streptomyces sp. NPDC015350 TaxID=3364955 RepID=UPI0036FBEB85